MEEDDLVSLLLLLKVLGRLSPPLFVCRGISAPSLSPQGESTPGAFGPGVCVTGVCVTGVSAPRLVVPITMPVVPVGVFGATTANANASRPQAWTSQFVHISRGYRTSWLKPLHKRGLLWNQPSLLQ